MRFNPDSYFDGKEKNVPGCFCNPGRKGVKLVNDGKSLNARLEILFEHLESALERPPENGTLEVTMLFFDGYEFLPWVTLRAPRTQ